MSSQTAREIDEEAAAWALKIGPGELPRDREFEAWLQADPRRTGALLRAQAALSFIDRGRALEDFADPVRGPGGPRRPSRRLLLALSGAGGLIAAGFGAVAVLAGGKRYSTGIGEILRVPLDDGSTADINTATSLQVSLHGRSRDLVLTQGEAWFQVAKDPQRPFTVKSGHARVRAVGTAFSLRRWKDRSDLLVTEGVVEAWLQDSRKILVKAGSRITLGEGLALKVIEARAEIERSLAWRNGQIALDGETLAEAAAEFNRYNRRPLVVEDPALARRQFVGLFRTNDPQSFALAVAATSGARLVEDDAAIRLR